jgi:hypothetical protein
VKKYIVGGGIAVVVLTIVIALLSWNSAVNKGNAMENGLNKQYLVNQNELSNCVTQIRETAKVAQAESDAFTKAMEDAIKGRYDGRAANPGQMFSAITENYPDLKDLNKAFERVYLKIVECRGDYKLVQNKLLSQLQGYDDWRTATNTGRIFGGNRPSDHLVAQIGTNRLLTGKAAYAQMLTIVTTADTKKAYETGNLEPEDPFSKAPATPAK